MPAPSHNQTDQELIAAVNAGDDQAFAILYERHRDWVVQLAYRFTGHHDDALDVLQETFAYFVRKFPGFVLTAQLTTFFYPAVRNLSIAARKKRQRVSSGDTEMEQFAAAEPTDSMDRDDFSDLLQTLSDQHREILMMRFVDGMTQPEIAAALDIPLGTVKSRLHHAIQSVKNSPAAARLAADI